MSERGIVATENKLKQSVERLQALLDEIPTGVINVDIKGKITYVNKTILQRTGYLREDLVGKNGFRLGLFPRETLKVLGRRMKEKLMGKPPSPLEIQFKRKDGTWMWVEISGKALWEHGIPVGIQIVGQDITERKRMEEALWEAKIFAETIITSVPEVIYSTDSEMNLTYISPKCESLYGYTANEFVKDPAQWMKVAHPDDQQMLEPLVEMVQKGEPYSVEYRIISKDGAIHWVLDSGVPTLDSEGKLERLDGSVSDITERKRMEQELRETQEQLVRSEKLAAIGQLAGGVGHELRNPLGAIKNAVYYIKGKVAKSELAQREPRLMEFLDIMDDEINASNRIINDLLGFSRVGKPSVSPTKIEKVIEDALSRMHIPENIELTKKLDADLPEVEIDADQVRQVWVNIIMNAVQAMPKGGKLTIGAREKGEFLEVEIADTGGGIPQEAVGKIFDPLFTTKAKGIGFGLAVCKTIIDSHQGNIKVKSQVGKGTTFIIKLPLKVD